MTEPARNATLSAGATPSRGRLGRADVRAHGDVHADEAGRGREHRADQEADRGAPAELVVEAEREERHDRDDRDRRVLLAQVRGGALLDGARDLLHPLVARGLLQQPPGQVRGRTAIATPAQTSANSTAWSLKKSIHPPGQGAQSDAEAASARGIMQHKPEACRVGTRAPRGVSAGAGTVSPTCSA